jgi:Holliday junction resolvase-like predicted endonuclease
MLYESEVSAAVVNYLHAKGYHINKESKPTEKGIDIIAENDSEVLCIEVKVETSFREGSKRFGKPFHSGQVTHHVALYSTLKDFDKQAYGSKTRVAMAFPDTPEF